MNSIIRVKLNKLIVIMFIINMIVMISDYKVVCNYIGAVLSAILVLLILWSNGFSIQNRSVTLWIVLFILYFVLTSLINGEVGQTVISIAYYNIEFLVIFFALYLERNEDTDATFVKYADRKLLLLFFLTWDLFCFISIYYYLQTPDLARLMAAYRSEYRNLIIGGGYPMAYGSVVLGTFLFHKLINKEIPKKYNAFVLFEIILMVIVVYLTNSFICLLAMILGFAICFARSTMKGAYFILSLLFFGALAVVIYANIGKILSFILNNIQNEFLESRLQEIYNELVLGDTSFHLDKRSSLYQMSFDSFMEHPVFGVGYTYGNDSAVHRLNGIGSHSTLLDTLGQFGVVGSIPFYLVLLYPIISNIKKKENSMYLVTFIAMLALNPSFSTFHLVLVVYLIIPAIMRELKYCKNR